MAHGHKTDARAGWSSVMKLQSWPHELGHCISTACCLAVLLVMGELGQDG